MGETSLIRMAQHASPYGQNLPAFLASLQFALANERLEMAKERAPFPFGTGAAYDRHHT